MSFIIFCYNSNAIAPRQMNFICKEKQTTKDLDHDRTRDIRYKRDLNPRDG